MNGFVLFVWFIISNLITSGESCTKGFMDYDLLVQKAEQIERNNGRGDLYFNDLRDDRHSIMPSLEFNCSGTITGFLLGVDVRTETKSGVEYPTIWLWNKTDETTYTRVVDSSVEIILGPSNFSTDGVYQFSLTTPLQFTANQVLGIYQSDDGDSEVRFYYQDYNGQNIYETFNENEYTLGDGVIQTNRRPLIYPETNSPQCISGFISSDEIKIQAREITRVRGYRNDEIFFPDIGFTCNGNITHIIIGAEDDDEDDDDGTLLPQIRFWRLSDGGEYEQTGSSYSLLYNDANDPSTTNLRWYNLSQPIQVQNEDVLGIYQPRKGDLILYYQENSGPPNYDENGNIEYGNDYPLVSVIFETISMIISSSTMSSSTMSSTSKTFTSTSISSTMSSKSKTTSSLLSITAEATSHNIITSSITLSEVMSSTSMSSTFDGSVSDIMSSITSSTTAKSETLDGLPVQLAGVGTGLLLLSIIIFIIILIIILIVKHRKRTTHMNSSKKDEDVIINDNPAYQLHTVSSEHVTTDDNPSYNIHKVSDEHMLTYDYDIIHTVSGEHLTTDDDNTYSYVHVLDEPVVENDYI